jgi:hypothetical protein
MISQCGAAGKMRIGRRNKQTRRKPAPMPLCPQHFVLEYRKRADSNKGILQQVTVLTIGDIKITLFSKSNRLLNSYEHTSNLKYNKYFNILRCIEPNVRLEWLANLLRI